MKFRVLGFCAIILAKASAYSAYAPLNCSFVAPYTSPPTLNPETSDPIASTIPDSSEPRIIGKGWSSTLPSRREAGENRPARRVGEGCKGLVEDDHLIDTLINISVKLPGVTGPDGAISEGVLP
jgi:hypothetical protein